MVGKYPVAQVILVSLAILVTAILIAWLVMAVPVYGKRGIVGPYQFPFVILVTLAILMVAILIARLVMASLL